MMPHQDSASETAPRSIYDPGGQHTIGAASDEADFPHEGATELRCKMGEGGKILRGETGLTATGTRVALAHS